MKVSEIEVLATVGRLGAGVSAQEIAGALGIAPATAYRVLNAMVAEEYLVRMPDLRGFAVGRRAQSLVASIAPGFVPVAARQVLMQLRQRVRFGVHLVSYSTASLRLVDADPDHPPRSGAALGRYLHASAAGKLLLAGAADWRDVVAAGAFRPLTAHTAATPAHLTSMLEAVRRNGFAVQVDELVTGVSCLAVPIRDATGGRLHASLAVSGPSERAAALHEQVPALLDGVDQLRPLLT